MNQNGPIFKIDEEVILASPEYPEFNGEYIVHRIDTDSHVYWYDLGFSCPEDVEFGGTLWNEGCLKKKHKPSSYSFEELINEANGVQA